MNPGAVSEIQVLAPALSMLIGPPELIGNLHQGQGGMRLGLVI
jgi:hypothetical protein